MIEVEGYLNLDDFEESIYDYLSTYYKMLENT
jgi:hypothetical protein